MHVDLIKCECVTCRVKFEITLKFLPMSRSHIWFSESIDQRQYTLEIINQSFQGSNDSPFSNMRLFTETLEFVCVLFSMFFPMLTINVIKLDIFDILDIVLIPFFFESPQIFKTFNFLIDIIKISRRCITDFKHFKTVYHFVPSVP